MEAICLSNVNADDGKTPLFYHFNYTSPCEKHEELINVVLTLRVNITVYHSIY